MQQWLTLAVLMGLMLSPESLVMLGNSVGMIGTNTAASLILALLTALLT